MSSIFSPSIHITKDGSSTLYSHIAKQHYHSNGGAVTESKFVYFELSGLLESIKNGSDISVLEVGFGTGLNFLILMDEYLKANSKSEIHFHSVEAHPINSATFDILNYDNYLDNKHLKNTLSPIYENLKPGLNTFKPLADKPVFLHFNVGWFKDITFTNLEADYIIHDAFSPNVNSELWSANVFRTLKNYASGNCILTTYCAAVVARAALSAADWIVTRGPGILGKRETTIASLNSAKLSDFKLLDSAKLKERYNSGEFNALFSSV